MHQFEGQLYSNFTETTENRRHTESDYQQELQHLVANELTWIPSSLEARINKVES